MLEIAFNNHAYRIPDRWEELTPQQFIHLVGLLRGFTRGELSTETVRALFFLDAAGLKLKRIHNQEQVDRFAENVYRIADQLNFMFRIEYENKKAFSAFSEGTRKVLYRILPEELADDSAEIRAARKLKKHRVIDAVVGKNLIPEVPLRRNTIRGYTFDQTGNLLQFDLTAGDFIDACTVYDQFSETGDPVYLDLITAALYGNPPIETIRKIDPDTKAAILFNFQSNLLFLQENTDYAVLWWTQPEKSKKKATNRLGFSDSLYTIAKAGYGDLQGLKELPVIDFLNLLIKELRDAVLALKESKKNNAEIAEATHLTLAQVNFLAQ